MSNQLLEQLRDENKWLRKMCAYAMRHGLTPPANTDASISYPPPLLEKTCTWAMDPELAHWNTGCGRTIDRLAITQNVLSLFEHCPYCRDPLTKAE